VTARYKT